MSTDDTQTLQPISTAFLAQVPRDSGLLLDFSQVAESLPEDAGQRYVRVNMGRGEDQKRRAELAEAHVITTRAPVDLTHAPDVTANGMVIKNSGDFHVGLPDAFNFALTRVNAACLDALQLYGADRFKDTQMMLVVHRTDIEPDVAHRPVFSKWHNHVNDSGNIDFAYLFHDIIGTQYQFDTHKGEPIERTELTAPDGLMTRMGSELMHRSRENDTGEQQRREWGAILVHHTKPPLTRADNGRSSNRGLVRLDDDNFDRFAMRGMEALKIDTTTTILPETRTLIEHLGVQPVARDGLDL